MESPMPITNPTDDHLINNLSLPVGGINLS